MTAASPGRGLEEAPRHRPEAAGRWQQLALLAAAVLLALAPWFSAAAVAPSLAEAWQLTGLSTASLTVAVQLGFAAGAIGLALAGAPDVVPPRFLVSGGAFIAAAANLLLIVADGPVSALLLRALTGAGLAAVYPVAMKVLAGWFGRDRGLAVGVLIGAITLGSALPHLLRWAGLSAGLDWEPVVAAASVVALVGAVIALAAVRDGPLAVPSARFTPALALRAVREPSVRLANLGYLGHMWELYAMWTWVPVFLAASLAAAGAADSAGASGAAFAVVAAGAIGCVGAGAIADRLGRTPVTMAAMALSGSSAVVAGLLFGAPIWLVIAVAIAWGVTVVADSAQFSTAISELSPPGTAGSALTLQTAGGFLLTGVTILLVGLLDPADAAGWRTSFALLALGPAVGIVAMWRLRHRPEAVRMAHGRR